MRHFTRILIIGFALISIVAWTGVYFASPGKTDGVSVTIIEGDHASAVANLLKMQGIIRSELIFKRIMVHTGADIRLQPGVYDLTGARSYTDIAEILSSGGALAEEVSLTVLEGWSLHDIATALEKKGLPGSEELFAVTGVPGIDYRDAPELAGIDLVSRFPFLMDKPDNVSLEGYLFPDTYRFYPDATVGDVLDAMLGNFDAKLTQDIRDRITASGMSVFEAVTIASIIEREVFGADDRRIVSGIIANRLRIGMALQMDSSVNYVTGKSLPSVTYEDLQEDSLYNTYKHAGLPLGPIGNPGLEAILAAISPADTEYLYFLTDPEGNVHYGRTHEEHIVNRNLYLR